MARNPHSYVPAMGSDRLLRLYDPLTTLLGVRSLHRDLVDAAEIAAGQQVLEIGCGTGNLALQIAERFPDAHVCGLDPDPRALTIARAKARRRGATVQWDEGSATQLPYPDASMDRVVSSLMFHHVDGTDRERVLAEVRRVLRPGGQLHLVDFVGHGHGLHAWLGRRNRRIAANGADAIPDLMTRAGLREVTARPRGNRLGTTSYRAHR